MATGWGRGTATTGSAPAGGTTGWGRPTGSTPVVNPVGSQQQGGNSGAINNALNAIAHQQPQPIQQIAPPNLSNYAQNNPGLESALEAARRRAALLQSQEGRPDQYQQESINNLRDRMSHSNTQHAIDVAGGQIGASAAGAQAAQDEMMARRGLGHSGIASRGASGISEAAERAKAQSATQLSLAEQQRLDSLALGGNAILQAPSQLGLAQQGLTNSALGLQLQGAGALANQGLAQQGLGLNQWQTAQNAAVQQQQLQQQQQQMQWQQLMALLGIAGQGGYGYAG
mgnify:CR=1 FL=1